MNSMSMKEKAKQVLPNKIVKGFSVLKNEGIGVLIYKVKNYNKNKGSYELWIKQNEKNILDTEPLTWNPQISVVVPVYNVADQMLVDCIESVIHQTYVNWELCLVDDCSTMESVRKVLKRYEGNEKIKIAYRTENGHISRTTNDGIAMATGEYVGLMDCDDILAVNALYEMANLLNKHPEYDFIYSDEDKIDEDGKKRSNPFFKPDWSPDTFMSYMYTCHFSIFRKELLDKLGGERVGFEGSQDYDLVLRMMEVTRNIGHVAKILYHWRMRKESTANDLTAKPYIIESTIKAKEEALVRRGLKGHLECIKSVSQYRVVYEPQDNPCVSIIIPSKDNYEIMHQCIESIIHHTNYDHYEIIVVDNGSNDENQKKYYDYLKKNDCLYVYDKKKFNFSYMCNVGAKHANGEYLLFLNDDVEIPKGQEKWLDILLGQAQIDYTGAVGAKLIYPGTNLIQHAGVINLPIGPGHAFHKFDDNLNCYWGRNILDYNYAIVTGACLMVRKSKFMQVNGYDESFPIAYNDVDFCFKLLEGGYYNVLRNDVKLIHHESISRGSDETTDRAERLLRERQRLYQLHPKFVNYDPCYNPNLTPDNGDFAINLYPNLKFEKIEEAGKITDYQKMDEDIKYHVDTARVEDGELFIKGWAFQKNKNAKKTKVELLLISAEGKCKKISVEKRYRGDISGIYKKYGNVAFSGFESLCYVPKNEEGNTYQIGLLIQNNCIVTDAKVSF